MKKRRKCPRINLKLPLRTLTLSFVVALIVGPFSALVAPTLANRLKLRYIAPKIVSIVKPSNYLTGGTGFFINTSKGIKILTNAHVCSLAENNQLAILNDSGWIATVNIYKVDSHGFDLCLLDAPEGYEGLTLGSKEPLPGDVIEAYGHPALEPVQISTGLILGHKTITVIDFMAEKENRCNGPDHVQIPDPIEKKMHCILFHDANQSTMGTAHGASGSPVLNIWGKVVGVIFALEPDTRHAYLVRFWQLKLFLQAI